MNASAKSGYSVSAIIYFRAFNKNPRSDVGSYKYCLDVHSATLYVDVAVPRENYCGNVWGRAWHRLDSGNNRWPRQNCYLLNLLDSVAFGKICFSEGLSDCDDQYVILGDVVRSFVLAINKSARFHALALTSPKQTLAPWKLRLGLFLDSDRSKRTICDTIQTGDIGRALRASRTPYPAKTFLKKVFGYRKDRSYDDCTFS